jgi:hypothetical protein
MRTFAVITPTIGGPELEKCILSFRGQDCKQYLVVDGREHFSKVAKIIDNLPADINVSTIQLEENIGKVGGNWYGHRAFAAASFLVNEDVLCFVDPDNWVEPDYISAFRAVLDEGYGYPWAYTLRKVVNAEGAYIAHDNCESLGHWPVMATEARHHIDTGCFAVPRELALKVGHNWYGQWGADRQFYNALKDFSPKYGCTNEYTFNYRLGGATNMASQEMFIIGNQITLDYYKGEYPWQKQRSPKPQTMIYNTR